MKKFNPGDEITAIYQVKGVTYIRLLRVTKVGRKYIHGTTLFPDYDDHLREGHPTTVNIETSIIHWGLRLDLVQAEHQYRKDYQGWQNQREEQRSNITWELRKMVQNRLDDWEADNPQPKPPEIQAPEALLTEGEQLQL